jgi:ankyrin repeat protein
LFLPNDKKLNIFSSKNLNTANKKGWTCLMYACYYGNENLIDRIIELDPTTLFATNNDKQTPLMIATMSGNISIVKKIFRVSKNIIDYKK